MFIQQQTSVVHCAIQTIKITRPTYKQESGYPMFIGEIGVIDKNGQPVGMVGNVSLGASTKLSCYTGQNLNSGSCAKAKKAVNYKGSACCASSTSYLNDGDASTIHGAVSDSKLSSWKV